MKSELAELDRISDYPTYWAARHPDREAMVLGDLRWTYADLARYVEQQRRLHPDALAPGLSAERWYRDDVNVIARCEACLWPVGCSVTLDIERS